MSPDKLWPDLSPDVPWQHMHVTAAEQQISSDLVAGMLASASLKRFTPLKI